VTGALVFLVGALKSYPALAFKVPRWRRHFVDEVFVMAARSTVP